MQGLTINEAAETTGWTPRMLRYLEDVGLIRADRSASGYRLYGAAQLQRLRTLRELLDRHGCGLSEVAFAKRMKDDPGLASELDRWFEEKPRKPEDVPSDDWLKWEQEKHQRLLALTA